MKTIEQQVNGMCFTSVDDLRTTLRCAESTGHWPAEEAMIKAYAKLIECGYKTKAKVLASFMRKRGLKVKGAAK